MNLMETRTIGGNGLVYLPKLILEKAQLNETNKAFITILGETIIVKRQQDPDEKATLRNMVLDMLYAMPLNTQFDIACTMYEHLSEQFEKEKKGAKREL